jgi:hypothetical protein
VTWWCTQKPCLLVAKDPPYLEAGQQGEGRKLRVEALHDQLEDIEVEVGDVAVVIAVEPGDDGSGQVELEVQVEGGCLEQARDEQRPEQGRQLMRQPPAVKGTSTRP